MEKVTENRLGRFIQLCRERGLRMTPQRLTIYEAIASSREHPSAEMIYHEVRKRHPMISLATVYKTLETLKKIGAITQVNPVEESARYEANLEPHHHLVCVRCKKLVDLYEGCLEEIPLPDQLYEHIILGHTVWIRGLCPDCQKP